MELTEGILIEDHGDVVDMLQSLRDLGVTIVVDDFGRGYSSLAYLTKFPIDKIKIDRSFISEITSLDTDAAIVDAIIVMAHALGMTVVAEGVETEVQEQYLRERGCDEVQGYRYSPGVPAADLVTVAQGLAPVG
ncbi:EAL domain-containing protein [Nocardioides sp. W3-2-3]|uniref:EAL domain-containing protein n=1 Tax=Nocardioides convexus TaxID=2712224 RepID=UPI0024185276|nr:EAL domain-containing protein [Nocardioides convexus]NGZ99488.1 EAL domain-containing protein [Nocardioides convexus]